MLGHARLQVSAQGAGEPSGPVGTGTAPFYTMGAPFLPTPFYVPECWSLSSEHWRQEPALSLLSRLIPSQGSSLLLFPKLVLGDAPATSSLQGYGLGPPGLCPTRVSEPQTGFCVAGKLCVIPGAELDNGQPGLCRAGPGKHFPADLSLGALNEGQLLPGLSKWG